MCASLPFFLLWSQSVTCKRLGMSTAVFEHLLLNPKFARQTLRLFNNTFWRDGDSSNDSREITSTSAAQATLGARFAGRDPLPHELQEHHLRGDEQAPVLARDRPPHRLGLPVVRCQGQLGWALRSSRTFAHGSCCRAERDEAYEVFDTMHLRPNQVINHFRCVRQHFQREVVAASRFSVHLGIMPSRAGTIESCAGRIC